MLGATAAGLLLRLHGYADQPSITQNADELQFAWLGVSLLTTGVPTSWAYQGAYGAPVILHLHGTTYPLVHPWFDHPPLFGLITGGAALLGGQRTFAAVDMSTVRLPVVLMGTACIPLVHELGRRVLGAGPAAAAAVLVAVSPPLVLMGRVAEPEALLAPLFLLALVFAHSRLTGRTGAFGLAAIAAICVLAPLAKVTGLAIGGVLALVFLAAGRWREAAICAGAAVLSLVIFALYGAAFGWTQFAGAIAYQNSHRSGVMSGLEFIGAFAGNNHHLYDGWWLLGWLGIAAVAVARWRAAEGEPRGEAWLLAWPVAAYLAVIVILADQTWVATYGWYRVAVYPLVYLAAAALAWRLLEAPSVSLAALVLALGGSTSVEWWLGSPWVAPAIVAVPVFAALILPAALGRLRPARLAGAVALALMAVGCVVQSFQVNQLAGRL